MWIDSHCHLDFDELSNDLDGVVARMAENNVCGCVTISTQVDKFDGLKTIVEAHNNIWCSVGTHPMHVSKEPIVPTSELVRLTDHPKCVAIGEAGLDYHYDNSPKELQETCFRNHIAAARQTGLPLVIHSRDADEDMGDILEEESGKGAFPFVLHCFSSGAELAHRGIALGGYVSFSGILTFNNADEIREVAGFTPLDRLLVETDAPFLAPVPNRGKTNEPGFVRHTGEKLAELRELSAKDMAKQTTDNFARLFSKTGIA